MIAFNFAAIYVVLFAISLHGVWNSHIIHQYHMAIDRCHLDSPRAKETHSDKEFRNALYITDSNDWLMHLSFNE
jgi:hypothetical protein